MVKLCGSNCVMRNEEVCVLMVLFCAVSGVEGSNANSGSKRCKMNERNLKCEV